MDKGDGVVCEGDPERLVEGAGLLPVWRARLLGGLWRAALKVPGAWRLSAYGRCRGGASAACFVPTPGIPDEDGLEGYYRWGILAQHCQRFRWHRGACVAPINIWGHRVPGGAAFAPERGR